MSWSLSWIASLSQTPPHSDAAPSSPAWGPAASVPRAPVEDARVLRAQAGDGTAFAELYHACGPAVSALLRAMLPRDQVEDVHQEVFLAAWRALPRFDARADFRPWVYGIARNLVKRQLRSDGREARKRVLASHQAGPRAPEPGAASEQQERVARVMAHLHSLPPSERELLGLRLIEGMSPQEIAIWIGSTPGSVRVHRALTRLRALCQEDES